MGLRLVAGTREKSTAWHGVAGWVSGCWVSSWAGSARLHAEIDAIDLIERGKGVKRTSTEGVIAHFIVRVELGARLACK